MSKFNLWDKITIAAACNRDLRQNRVTPNTTANEPIHGWRLNTSHSKVALEWLHWEEHRLLESPEESVGIRFRHAANQGEYHIPNSRYTVDGYD